MSTTQVMAQSRKDVTGKKSKTPFSQNRYKSDRKYFRAVGNAESSKVRSAEQKARVNAMGLLADQVETIVKKVTTDYMKEVEVGNSMDFQTKFESMVMTVTNQVMTGATEKDSQLYTKKKKLKKRNEEGKKKIIVYNFYVVMQANKDQLLAAINAAATTNQDLTADYNQAVFQKLFDAEMDKVAVDNGNGDM